MSGSSAALNRRRAFFMGSDHIIVAVDGPAGSGKSSVSKEVAKRLGISYVDSGAIYRAITWLILRNRGAVERGAGFADDLAGASIDQRFLSDGACRTTVDGVDVSDEIRTETIAKNIGIISDDVRVRAFVNDLLRERGRRESLIMDGRDIGTVVFPDADVKIYLDASVAIRAERRINEYREKGKNLDVNEITKQIIQRDSEDTGRPVGRLVQADDAVYLDTTALTKDDVIDRIVEIITQHSGTQMEHSTNGHDDAISMEHIADSLLDGVAPNTIVEGEIVTIDGDFAYVNVGTKYEGKVRLNEFDAPPVVGDRINVMLVNRKLFDGTFVFSKRAADQEVAWKRFMEHCRSGAQTVSGTIKGTTKNGLFVDVFGAQAYLPFSHAADLKAKKSQEVRIPYEFVIKSVDEKKRGIVLSRKDYLDEAFAKKWEEFVAAHAVGDRIRGRGVRFVESGVIVDCDGISAFLHRDDLSWRKVIKKKKYCTLGEEAEFMIMGIDQEARRITLGLKQLTEDPWARIDERYKPGDKVPGRVVTVAAFGLFVEIEEGVEGLVNNANLSWTKKNVPAKDAYQKGQKIEVMILDINKADRRLSLGLKQLLPNPWETVAERFPVGTVLRRPVKKIVSFGMFVELEEDVDGMVHVSDITWDEGNKNPLSSFSVGDEIEFKILEINSTDMKISCGMKQLTKSPWEAIKEKYPPRTRVSGAVSGIVSFGLFVKLEDGVEGLVHVSEVSKKKIENLAEQFKVGDPVGAVVLDVDVNRRRLSLSMKLYDIVTEKEDLDKVLSNTTPKTVTIGDLLKKKLGE